MRAVALHLGEVAHAAQQPVGDARRAARAARDLEAAVGVDRHVEQAGRAARRCCASSSARVELEPGDDAEAVAQRVGQHAGARGRADQRERLQLELDRARRRALADHDVDLVVLERRIEDLLDHRREAVDLVDEEDVVLLEVGEDRRQVLGLLEHRPRGLAQVDAELVGDDVRRASSCRGPAGRTAARGPSPRRASRAAPMKISSCSRAFAWPTYSASRFGRSARSIASSLGEPARAADDAGRRAGAARRAGPGANSSVWMLMAALSSAPARPVRELGREPDAQWRCAAQAASSPPAAAARTGTSSRATPLRPARSTNSSVSGTVSPATSGFFSSVSMRW